MASWGHRQQAKIIGTAVIIAVVLIGLAIYYGFFRHTPTCFDGVQNGDETGIDCGGSCQKVCLADELNPLTRYTRVIEVSPGLYSAIAIIENPNPLLYAENVPYTFRVLDQDGVVIAERHGLAFLPPHKIIPIFEGTIKTGIRVPRQLSFQFDQAPNWQRAELVEPILNINNQLFSNTGSSPRLEADIQNLNPNDFKNIMVVALLYDQDNNVYAASETLLDTLNRRATDHIVFTWPSAEEQPVKIEITPIIPYQNFLVKK